MAMEKQERKRQLEQLGAGLLETWQAHLARSQSWPLPAALDFADALPVYRAWLQDLSKVQKSWLQAIDSTQDVLSVPMPWHWSSALAFPTPAAAPDHQEGPRSRQAFQVEPGAQPQSNAPRSMPPPASLPQHPPATMHPLASDAPTKQLQQAGSRRLATDFRSVENEEHASLLDFNAAPSSEKSKERQMPPSFQDKNRSERSKSAPLDEAVTRDITFGRLGDFAAFVRLPEEQDATAPPLKTPSSEMKSSGEASPMMPTPEKLPSEKNPQRSLPENSAPSDWNAFSQLPQKQSSPDSRQFHPNNQDESKAAFSRTSLPNSQPLRPQTPEHTSASLPDLQTTLVQRGQQTYSPNYPEIPAFTPSFQNPNNTVHSDEIASQMVQAPAERKKAAPAAAPNAEGRNFEVYAPSLPPRRPFSGPGVYNINSTAADRYSSDALRETDLIDQITEQLRRDYKRYYGG